MATQGNQGGGQFQVQVQVQPHPHPEYSLPGVMRYLQNEWQRNERDRIQWDLERAEMKTRIAKLEGEKRGLQLLVESHAKKIAILESCITQSRQPGTGDKPSVFDPYLESKALLDKELSMIHNSQVDLTPIIESRQYLEKCIQEIEYLLQSSNITSNGNGGPSNNQSDNEHQLPSTQQQEPLNNKQAYNQQQAQMQQQQQQQQQQQSQPQAQAQAQSQSQPQQKSKNGASRSGPPAVQDHKAVTGPTVFSDWKVSGKLAGHLDAVRTLDFLNAEHFVTGSDDGTIREWKLNLDGDSPTAEEIQVHRGHEGIVTCLCYDSVTNTIFSGGEDRIIRMWSPEEVTQVGMVWTHTGYMSALTIDEKNRYLASGSSDGIVQLWSLLDRADILPMCELEHSFGMDAKIKSNLRAALYEKYVLEKKRQGLDHNEILDEKEIDFFDNVPTPTCIAFVGGKSRIVIGYENSRLFMYDYQGNVKVQEYQIGSSLKIESIDDEKSSEEPIEGRGKKRAADSEDEGSGDSKKKFSDSSLEDEHDKTGEEEEEEEECFEDEDKDGHKKHTIGGILSVVGVVSSDSLGQIIAIYADGSVRAFDTKSGELLNTWQAHEGGGYSISLSDNGLELMTGGSDGSVKFWGLEAFKAKNIKKLSAKELFEMEESSAAAAGSSTGRADWRLAQEIEVAHNFKARDAVLPVSWYRPRDLRSNSNSGDGSQKKRNVTQDPWRLRLAASAGGDGIMRVFTRDEESG